MFQKGGLAHLVAEPPVSEEEASLEAGGGSLAL